MKTEQIKTSELKKIGQYYDKNLNQTTFRALGDKMKVEIPEGLVFSSEEDIEMFYTEVKKAFARVTR